MDKIIIYILPLLFGYILDLILGDPRKLPHPIVGFGNMIAFCEKKFNRDNNLIFKGVIVSSFLIISVFSFFYILSLFFQDLNQYSYIVFASIFIFFGLANRSLLQEGKAVFDALNNEGLEAGRKRLSWIVGRDTSNLTAHEIRLAVFETLSENLSDGVVAPLFYYAIGGVPGIMCYKMVNTLDSMIGYKNTRYLYFGRFAARFDDLANYIPSRITAFLMALVCFNYQALVFIFKFGNKHASPNAGYPEAALAGILDCRFGGTHDYGGESVYKPFIGINNRELIDADFTKIKYINHSVCALSILIICIVYLFIYCI